MSDPNVFDLARLIRPIELGTFFSDHWDKKPLLVQRDDRRYLHALFSIEEVDALLSNYGAPNEHNLRLVKRGGRPETVLLPPGSPPSLDRVYAAYREGYTVNVNDMSTHHPAIRAMTHAVLAEIGARPRPNMFLTPPGSRAFDLHFDTHDLMILQLGGAKEWRVYAPVETAPTAKHSDGSSVPRTAVGAPLVDTTLEAGDILYVPRGFVHEAYTGSRHSLHITLGMRMGTYLDLLSWMVETVGWRSPALRASIPPGALFGRSHAELKERMTALLRSELGEAVIDAALTEWGADELARMPPVDGVRFGAAVDGEPEITLDEPLRKPAELVTALVVSGGRARLHYQHGGVEGPWKIKPALELVHSLRSDRSNVVRARDLPGALDDAEKLVLAKRMVREGLLRRVR